MATLNEIRRSENDIEYWKEKSLYWWSRYIKNVKTISDLRRQNRQIRILLSDYINAEREEFDDQ
ncbi:hypothetical protein KAR91_21440 [Candidatus Pacearchaeota archaeon]|nr:hypothetical protein [Candidatus Pacearchaeota archaeon]